MWSGPMFRRAWGLSVRNRKRRAVCCFVFSWNLNNTSITFRSHCWFCSVLLVSKLKFCSNLVFCPKCSLSRHGRTIKSLTSWVAKWYWTSSTCMAFVDEVCAQHWHQNCVCPSYHHTTRLPDYPTRLKRRHLLRFQVQNLEKAGILNKTKVSENGKKVR